MLKVSVSGNFKGAVQQVERRAKQVEFATARALTWTGRDAKPDLEQHITNVFDRPTPFTKRAVAALPARRGNLVSRVLIKDAQAKYLGTQEEGGTRTPKGRAIVVPSSARTNRYGNLPRGAIRRMLARSDTFSANIGGTGGIWQRQRSGGLKLLVAYTQTAQYSKRFGMRDKVRGFAMEKFPQAFDKSLAQAFATAR